MYRSADAGKHWHELMLIAPKDVSKPQDGSLGTPTVHGADVTLAVNACCQPRGTTIIASSNNSGKSWRTVTIPGPLGYRSTALIDARHWRATDGNRMASTNDGGRSWRRWKSAAPLKDQVGSPLSLTFLNTPRLGFAIPDGNGGQFQRTNDGGKTWAPIRITFKSSHAADTVRMTNGGRNR
jgi:photosystem II stability/assembly factor-like uncharacterized protein